MVAINEHMLKNTKSKELSTDLSTSFDAKNAIAGFDTDKSTRSTNSLKGGLDKNHCNDSKFEVRADTKEYYEDTRDDAEFDYETLEKNSNPKNIGEFLHSLSEKRQIEGKKRRNAIQNKKKTDETTPATSYSSPSKTSNHNSELFDWLYGLSSNKQMEGKIKRKVIESKLYKTVPENRTKVPIKFDINGIVDPPKSKRVHEHSNQSDADESNIFYRLTHCAHSAQKKEEGKKKKESVDAALKAKHPDPKTYPKLPPSMHNYYYEKNVKYSKEREERIKALREKRDLEKKLELQRQRMLKAKREHKRRTMYGIAQS